MVLIARNLTAPSGLSLKKLFDPEPLYYQGKIFLTLVEKKSSLALIGDPPLQRKLGKSCMYAHGTVAFYIRRPLMEKVVRESRRGYFCRFPIDMYISKMGPWYATQRDIVRHETDRIGSA